jgi:hypothetical protein
MYREQGGRKLEGASFRTALSFPFLGTQIVEQINLLVSKRSMVVSFVYIELLVDKAGVLHSIGMAKEIVLLY